MILLCFMVSFILFDFIQADPRQCYSCMTTDETYGIVKINYTTLDDELADIGLVLPDMRSDHCNETPPGKIGRFSGVVSCDGWCVKLKGYTQNADFPWIIRGCYDDVLGHKQFDNLNREVDRKIAIKMKLKKTPDIAAVTTGYCDYMSEHLEFLKPYEGELCVCNEHALCNTSTNLFASLSLLLPLFLLKLLT